MANDLAEKSSSGGGKLAGQIAFVTGGSSGIGEGCVHALAEAGAKVVLNYHGSSDAAEAIVGEIEEGGGEAMAIQGDVSNEQDVEEMFARAVERFGTVHVLVNDAGIQKDARFVDMTVADWRRVIDVNLTGYFLCARAAAREFLRRGRAAPGARAIGSMIFVSSVHEAIPWAGHVNYAASKGGVMMLAKSLAQELAEHGIRVNGVAPGAIRTRINRHAWEDEEALERLLTLVPYGRIGKPDDISKAVVWLASDDSDYVTGATLVIDGGMMLYPAFRDNG